MKMHLLDLLHALALSAKVELLEVKVLALQSVVAVQEEIIWLLDVILDLTDTERW